MRFHRPGVRVAGASRTYASYSSILTDVLVLLVATEAAGLARYDFHTGRVQWGIISVFALFLAGGQLVIGAPVLLYRGRYQAGSFDEIRALAVSVTAVSVIASVLVLILHPHGLPRSLPFLAWSLALMGMAAIRFVKRLIIQAGNRPTAGAEPLLIFGAGWVGSVLALRMLRDPHSAFVPVGFLDDDPAKRNLQIHGIHVRGCLQDLASVAKQFGATRVVVAVSSADAPLIREVSDAADQAGLGCMVLPPLAEQLRRSPLQLSALRDVDVEDVIGRHPVDTDLKSIADYITGRRVLVTGAGGSIGAELCRQLHKYGPAELVMLDHDESALHAVELSIFGRALLDDANTALIDVRDGEFLLEMFRRHEPEVVFHAAALKHLPLLERHPFEALKSNVLGTRNVLDAASRVGVTHFVNISTDKAASPTSALGHSKHLAERLTAWYALGFGERYLSVRFGNVLGSRGSVLHTFAAQIEAGGPVTVTDPEVTRFFMTIPEACQLLIQAGAIGRPGEALVLDMGEPVSIVDVARRMIASSGKAIDVVFTGLRPGEKLHEELMGENEWGQRPLHPMISHVSVPPLDPDLVEVQPWVRATLGTRQLQSLHYSDISTG